MNCAEARDRFDALLDGDLPSGGKGPVEAHLARCRTCEAEFASLRRAIEGLRGIPLLRTPAGFERAVLARIRAKRSRFSRRRRVAAIAAAAILAASSPFLLRSPDPTRPSPFDLQTGGSPPALPLDREPPVSAGSALSAEAKDRRFPRGSGVPWNQLAREGLRLVANAADLAARLRAATPPTLETGSQEGPPPEESKLLQGPPDSAPVAAAELGTVPSFVASAKEEPPFRENAAIVREGDQVVLRTAGPPDREIPALLGILRDEGGEAADLARSRLASIAAELTSRGVAAAPAKDEARRPLRRLRAVSADPANEDSRTGSLNQWETWWEWNRSSIALLARGGP